MMLSVAQSKMSTILSLANLLHWKLTPHSPSQILKAQRNPAIGSSFELCLKGKYEYKDKHVFFVRRYPKSGIRLWRLESALNSRRAECFNLSL